MKREPVSEWEISEMRTLFIWQECMFCKQEFRREDGYRFRLQVNQVRSKSWYYSCGECSCSISHCCDNIEAYTKKNSMPSKPPIAPPRKS